MKRRMAVPCLLSAAAIVAASWHALAGTDTDQLTVTATVQSGCSLSGGSLDFGAYTSGQQTDLDATGKILYTSCSGELSLALDGGASGSVSARQMRSGANRLSYQIYRNPTRSAVWGTGADVHRVTLIGTGAQSGEVTVYGRIPKGQTVPDGVYTDVLNITLTF